MIKYLAVLAIIFALTYQITAYPADSEVATQAQVKADLDSGESTGGTADLKSSETFGFGYYPGFYGGGGGFGGYGPYYGGGYGYGRHWGYGGYGGYGGYYRRPIYPVFGR